jgi:hypothetical protein
VPIGPANARQSEYEQNHRNRPGNHQLRRGRDGRRRVDGHHQPGRRAADAVGGGVHEDRRAAGGPGGQAPGGHQPGEHGLLHQALHGASVQRGDRGNDDGALQGVAGSQRRRPGEGAGQGLHAPRDLRDDPAETQAGGRGAPGAAGHAGGHHRAGVLQRRAAPGDQGCRPDRRPRGQAHRQRTDGGGAGLRPRQEEGRDDCRLRLRRRHVRHLGPGSGRGRRRGEVHQRRHPPRWRQPRPADHRLDHRRVQEDRRHRPRERPHGAPAAEGSGGEGQDGVVHGGRDRHQPAVHHGGPSGPEAPVAQAVALEVRAAGGRPDPEDRRADPAGAQRCRRRRVEDRRGRAGGRVHA